MVGDGIPVDVGSTARSVNLAQKQPELLEESMTLARVTPGYARKKVHSHLLFHEAESKISRSQV
ncbi:hypothetical protein K0M31_015357 [Melipona bicolor]|uniref:Uncharacterized protein n=1 Tax=Melipona bicolor TaxID=60889 RepID=A0AA40FFI6_9HYME|nr:hypothetical protein K0M31_015357 [Melipona bicolor]